MYYKKVWKAGRTIEVSKVYSARRGRNIPRSKNIGTTRDAQEAVNRRNAIAGLRRILNANFKPGDWHCIFSYPMPIAPDESHAKRDMDLFIRRLRPLYKKHGQELKYVAVMEKAKRIHHHMVLPDLPEGMKEVKALWRQLVAENYYTPEEREMGEPQHLRFPWSSLDESGQYGALAEYLLKESDKTRRESAAAPRHRYRASRNLERPQPTVYEISAHEWRKEPPERKGYYVDKSASFNGVNEETGLPMQHTIYVAIARKVRPRP